MDQTWRISKLRTIQAESVVEKIQSKQSSLCLSVSLSGLAFFGSMAATATKSVWLREPAQVIEDTSCSNPG